jgi:uncharacterized membrane protein YgcG
MNNHPQIGNLNFMDLVPAEEPPIAPQLQQVTVPNVLVQNYMVAPPPNVPIPVSNVAMGLPGTTVQGTGQIDQPGGPQEFPTGFGNNFIPANGPGINQEAAPVNPPSFAPAQMPPQNGLDRLDAFRSNRGPPGQNPVRTAPQTAQDSVVGGQNLSGGLQSGGLQSGGLQSGGLQSGGLQSGASGAPDPERHKYGFACVCCA